MTANGGWCCAGLGLGPGRMTGNLTGITEQRASPRARSRLRAPRRAPPSAAARAGGGGRRAPAPRPANSPRRGPLPGPPRRAGPRSPGLIKAAAAGGCVLAAGRGRGAAGRSAWGSSKVGETFAGGGRPGPSPLPSRPGAPPPPRGALEAGSGF